MDNPTSLNKILNGINNTLNIANKVMPIYKEAKPIFQTVSSTYKNIKNNKNELSSILKLIKIKNELKKETNLTTYNKETKLITKDTYTNTNNPKFFI